MNCMVVESGGDRVVIDCGLMFPNAEQALGVEVIAPDLAYLKEAGKVDAILLTHAHEDHVGALHYLLREFPEATVCGTRFTLAVVKEKLGFFFVNYQGTRQRSGLSPGTFISTTIPALPVDRSDASISQAFFGNATTPIDPVVSKLLNFKSTQFGPNPAGFLIPSGDPTTGAFAISRPGKYTDDQFTSNWDREFRGGQDKLSARSRSVTWNASAWSRWLRFGGAIEIPRR